MSHIIKPDFLQLQNEPEKTKENERRLMDEVKRLKTKILTLVEKSLKKKSRMRLPSLKMKEIQQSKAEKLQIHFLRTQYELEKTFETNKYEGKKSGYGEEMQRF